MASCRRKKAWSFDVKLGVVQVELIDVLNANGYMQRAYDLGGEQSGAQLWLDFTYREF